MHIMPLSYLLWVGVRGDGAVAVALQRLRALRVQLERLLVRRLRLRRLAHS